MFYVASAQINGKMYVNAMKLGEHLPRWSLNIFTLGKLYKEVLSGKKVRVVPNYHHTDAFILETYTERGWWIFKAKASIEQDMCLRITI